MALDPQALSLSPQRATEIAQLRFDGVVDDLVRLAHVVAHVVADLVAGNPLPQLAARVAGP